MRKFAQYLVTVQIIHMEQAEDEEPCLDFFSPQFDPVRALHADPADVHLPCPDIQPYDNLDAYDSVMRGVRRQAPSGAAHEPANKGVEEKNKVEGVAASKRHVKSVIHFMECKQISRALFILLANDTFNFNNFLASSQSPAALLQFCRNGGIRVRVWIRHCAGVRGVCEGEVTAFDKHFNLVSGHIHKHCVTCYNLHSRTHFK